MAKKYLNSAMNQLSIEDLAGVIKTWLNFYKLPLNPEKLGEVFDKFHYNHGRWIVDNAKNIKMIGCH